MTSLPVDELYIGDKKDKIREDNNIYCEDLYLLTPHEIKPMLEEYKNKMDMIANDMVVNDMIEAAKDDNSDEEDENKFFEKYKNCTCCKGYVYKCNGDTCKSLGQCYCKMSDECENDGK